MNIPKEVKEICKTLKDNGYEAYIVGGFVRDKLLGIESSDVDITTNATPMELKNIFPETALMRERDLNVLTANRCSKN